MFDIISSPLDTRKLAKAMRAARINRTQLASLVGCSKSSITKRLNGSRAKPPGFTAKLEQALQLKPGSLGVSR
jgi:hypothetical protein